MADQARSVRDFNKVRLAAGATVAAYQVWQLPTGEAGVLDQAAAINSGTYGTFTTRGSYNLLKDTTAAILAGGRVYWDRSAGQATYKKVDDRDFYVGRAVEDAAAANPSVLVELNYDPAYDLDLARDPYTTAPTGTQALGGFLPPQRNGGAVTLLCSSTSEAQKADCLSKDGFAFGCPAVVEAAFNVISVGSGSAPDFNVGVASATHATDADSIAQHLFAHMNGNDTKIYFQSKDGTTTVAAADSTKTATAGAGNANRVEVWFDLRTPASAKVYVNGVQVLTGTTFNVSAAASRWLLLAHLEKTSAADTFQVDVDWLRARYSEQ